MLTRKRQLAVKIESTEGTAETLAAADAKILAWNPKMSFDQQMFKRDPVRTTFGNIGKIPGKRPGGCSFSLEMRGSGVVGTAPEWGKIIQACGHQINTLKSINIGAITNGPFLHGETITGGTSGATGRVVIKTINGAANIMFVSLTGTFANGEVITGGTSTATATTSSTVSTIGNEIRPLSDSIPSVTIGGYEDGNSVAIRKLLRGCRGKMKFAFKSGQPGMMDFDFMGVEAGIIDSSLLSGIVFESTKPPAFMNAAFSVDGVSLKIGELDLDVASQMEGRDDINNDRGLLSFQITGREVSGSFNPEMLAVASHDFYGKWFSGTEMILDFAWGASAGNKFRFYAPAVQYTKIEDEDRGGIQIAKGTFDLNGSVTPGDDEYCLLCL